MKRSQTLFSFVFISMILFGLQACGEVHNEYYEVHMMVVEDSILYYINPTEGKDTISVEYLGEGESVFIYLYEPIDKHIFSYDGFFSTIETRYIEKDVRSDKLYLISNKEIDQLITQYFMDKEAWEASNPS